MNNIKDKAITPFYRNACIVMIWLTVFYTSVIQYVVIEIPYGMLILGAAVLLFYILIYSGRSYDFHKEIPEENIYMVLFMAYMFSVGTLIAIDKNRHLSQAITCLEYLFVLIVISSLIKGSGTESFHLLLLIKTIVLAIILLLKPVALPGGRYTISTDVNPNGLGMTFATGIWVVLYWQQKKKLPILLASALIVLFGYCIMSTGSRKSLIGAGLIIVLWLLLCYVPSVKEKGGNKGLLSFLVMGIMIVAIGVLFVKYYADSAIANRMETLSDEAQEGNRSDMYRLGLELIKSNPLFGIGFGGFFAIHGFYSHATIVEIPVSGGLVGFVLYFYVYYISIKNTFILYRKTRSIPELIQERMKIKMIILLWVAMLFYTICVIHLFVFDSFILFGIMFGETAHIKDKLSKTTIINDRMVMGRKYIKLMDITSLANEENNRSKYIK